MQVLNFIIKNILTQAAVVVGLIALLGLVLQKKPIGTVVSGTMKTILGFLVLSAGSSVIQGSLAIFGDLFNKAFGLKGLAITRPRVHTAAALRLCAACLFRQQFIIASCVDSVKLFPKKDIIKNILIFL